MTESQALLAAYARNGSESAFRELVTRYVGLVYSAALRLVGGDTHWAEDVTQMVFVDLARKAPRLPADLALGGWLHQSTYNIAAPMMRAERRRQVREKKATQMNALHNDPDAGLEQLTPILDEAIAQLGTEDRTAIIMRFFERCDFRAIGRALGTNDDAAQKRVSRALEKLHSLLKQRGVTSSATALGMVLATETLTAAPAGLATAVAGTALASAVAGGGGTTWTLLKMMTMKKGILAVVLIGLVTSVLVQHKSTAKLRDQARSLQEELDQVTAENARLESKGARQNPAPLAGQDLELLRLRGEVARLRQELQEADRKRVAENLARTNSPTELAWSLASRVESLRQELKQRPELGIPELAFANERDWLEAAAEVRTGTDDDLRRALGGLRTLAKNKVGFVMMRALQAFREANGQQLPSDWDQLKPYFKQPLNDGLLERYRLVRSGSANDVSNLRQSRRLVNCEPPKAG